MAIEFLNFYLTVNGTFIFRNIFIQKQINFATQNVYIIVELKCTIILKNKYFISMRCMNEIEKLLIFSLHEFEWTAF